MKSLKRVSIFLGALGVFFLVGSAWGHEFDTSLHHVVKKVKKATVVIDTKYNLMWEQKSKWPWSSHYKNRLFTWEEAKKYAKHLNKRRYAGQTTWRVPSAMEFSTLVDVGEYNPCIDSKAFPNNGNYHYWTSSEYPPIPSVVQYTSFVVGNQFKWEKQGRLRVRLVAGGGWTANYPGNADDFTIIDYTPPKGGAVQETVADNLTGLEWEQKTWCGDNTFGKGPVDEEIQRLVQFIPEIDKLAYGFFWYDLLPSGFIIDQLPYTPTLLSQLAADVPYFLKTLIADIIDELDEMKLEGHAMLGNRSFLMVFSYEEAKAYIDELNQMKFAGHNDWRLPTVEEIITTTDWNRVPCIKDIFSPTFTWLYWTGTPDPLGGRHYFT